MCWKERVRGHRTFATVRTDERMDGQASGQMERGNAVARAPGRGRRMMGTRRCVGGGSTTTAELSFLVRVYFSRDYKRS